MALSRDRGAFAPNQVDRDHAVGLDGQCQLALGMAAVPSVSRPSAAASVAPRRAVVVNMSILVAKERLQTARSSALLALSARSCSGSCASTSAGSAAAFASRSSVHVVLSEEARLSTAAMDACAGAPSEWGASPPLTGFIFLRPSPSAALALLVHRRRARLGFRSRRWHALSPADLSREHAKSLYVEKSWAQKHSSGAVSSRTGALTLNSRRGSNRVSVIRPPA